jgi:flagellum-specific ATP synthase
MTRGAADDNDHGWRRLPAPIDGARPVGARSAAAAKTIPLTSVSGVVTEIAMSHYRVAGLSRFLRLGECVRVDVGDRFQLGEVVRIDDQSVTLKPFDSRCDAAIGARAYRAEALSLAPCPAWKGRAIDALGQPIDGAGELPVGDRVMPIDGEPPPALRRTRLRKPIKSGIRVVDFFTPLCAGQRIGIFAGSGVGKSTMLAMLARAPDFDTVVIALVGERGREVREFLDDALEGNRQTAIAVVSTGDESPMMRRLAPRTAMAVAEYFRDRGDQVLLIVDSVTRFAHAARDVALAAGEPAVARGYAPSVFSDLPRLLERAGPGLEDSGSITGVFSVLVDGDDHNDPVADSIRGTLDGHIVLDRAIADQGRFPRRRHPRFSFAHPQPDLVAGAAQAGVAAARAHRPLRGDPRSQADGRLHARRRPAARPGGQVGAAHLRGDESDARLAALRRPLHRTRRRLARRRQGRKRRAARRLSAADRRACA